MKYLVLSSGFDISNRIFEKKNHPGNDNLNTQNTSLLITLLDLKLSKISFDLICRETALKMNDLSWLDLQKPLTCSPRENLCIFSVGSFQDTARFLQRFTVFSWGNDFFLKEVCSHGLKGSWQDLKSEYIRLFPVCHTGYWPETNFSWKKCVATVWKDPGRIWSMV